MSSMSTAEKIEIAKLCVSALTLLAIVVAYLGYRTNAQKLIEDRVRERDKELLSQAERSLQWAYSALTDDGKQIPPEAVRLKWLTSSRHLLRGRKIAEQIGSETYRLIYEEREDYWRYQFYVALDHESLRRWTYYANKANEEWLENIEQSSALVIVDFSNWRAGAADPTDKVDREALMSDGQGLKGSAGRGLEGYVVQLRERRATRLAEQGASSNPSIEATS